MTVEDGGVVVDVRGRAGGASRESSSSMASSREHCDGRPLTERTFRRGGGG